MSTLRVLLADDDTLVAHGFRLLLEQEPDIEIIGIAKNGQVAIEQVRVKQPDVVVMDVKMDVLDGVAATRRLRALNPECNILLLTTYDDDEYVYEGIRAGARGYMLKKAEPADLAEAIRQVADGKMVIHPGVVSGMVKALQVGSLTSVGVPASAAVPRLTPRELEVMYELADGRTNKQIAARLIISEHTVKQHVDRIFAKLGVARRQDVMAAARRYGLM